jgi:2-dehydropantoate 2-reductase
MKATIYGAGAIGGWIGVRLAQAGCDVSVVARGDTLAAVQAQGLRLETAGHTATVPVRASSNPADLGVQDLVVVAVKAPAMADVAPCHSAAARAGHHGAHRHERRALVVL